MVGEIGTIKDCLNRAAESSADDIALRFKLDGDWKTTTYRTLRQRTWHVAEMLATMNVQRGDRVAIYRDNSPEWYEIYHGIVGIGAIAVPVDAKLRELEVAHIFHDADISVVFCSARYAQMVAGMGDRLRSLNAVIVLDSTIDALPKADGITFYAYDAFWSVVSSAAKSGRRAFDRMKPDPGSPASFIYTSGTTGRQKGAVLTHRNFLANVEAIVRAIKFQKTDNVLLILPLHHSFAFTTTLLVPIYVQCQITLVENLKTIKANMAETAPTIMLAVPLLLEKMLARIMEGIQSKRSARILYLCGILTPIGRKVKQSLGGALRLIVSGGAPISPATLNTWHRLGFHIVEGYGITETAPVLSVNPVSAPRVGTVGLPLDDVEIKIDQPDQEGVGEIIARGENVMQGYHNNPEETAKVLKDGWYYTGDLGQFDKKGYLVISGRKKSMIVNREGKNIYPEEVELQVMKSTYVLECLVMGYCEPGQYAGERIGLIAVPNQEIFDAMEAQEGKRLTDQQIESQVREDIRTQLSELSEYKRPRKIEIRFEEFEKTTTQKIKRYLYAIDTTGR